jgi:hypothetical protein
VAEEAFELGSVKKRLKEFDDWTRWAHKVMQETKKPICRTCIKLDYEKGVIKPKEEYMKMKFIAQEGNPFITNRDHKKKIIEEYYGYYCPDGHKTDIKHERDIDVKSKN